VKTTCATAASHTQDDKGLEQFLAWEDRQELRYEFDGFQPVAMTGGTRAHAAIQANLVISLGTRLRGKPCRPFGGDLKIAVAGRIRYPYAFVVCTPGQNDARVVTDPVVVFEVLSKSTAETDLFVKNEEYRATPSILRYVILRQTEAAAIVFHRHEEEWVSDVVRSGGILYLPEIGIEVPLDEIYADLDFGDAAPEADAEAEA
jgi:Uma2 family endonuclease